ncbi:MAG: prolipoprotein diacylglyceryl transferase [Deltaproteobacteria bacterium]
MYPVFATLEMSPGTARVLGFVAVFVLSGYIVYDGLKTHGRAKLTVTLLQAVGFFVVSMGVALVFLTPERLPPEVVINLRSWGLMVVVGMTTCFLIQRHFGRGAGLTGEQILTLWVYGGICALIGARGLHVSVNWSDYAANPVSALTFWDGGMAFVGGALGALAFAFIYLRRIGLGLAALDALTLGVALTHGFGRIGCFMAGCCYGRPTDLPWAVSFPVGSLAQFTMAYLGQIGPTDPTPHLHPTQLYESLLTFAIGFVLLFIYLKKKPRPGTIVAGYFLAYSVVRFLIELVRDDPEREFPFIRWPADDPRMFSTTQTVSVVLVPLALFALWRIYRGGRDAVR